jgi:hypothetical protein
MNSREKTMDTKRTPSVFRVVPGRGKLWLCGFVVLLTVARDAHAYIDPGSGAFIWQLIVASTVGALFYVRNILRSIATWIAFFKRKTATKDD